MERLHEIILHTPALHIPPVDLTVAPGQVQNIQRANQRLAAMAQNQNCGRGRNAGLQGADPALIQILQRMEDRDNNRDLSHKKLLMFPKDMFNGNTKGLAKSHWLEFKKYLDYQQQQGFIDPTNRNSFAEIKQMFHMTLNDHALGWYDAGHANWTNIEQMQQAFLKQFNIWGDTRCQQQDSWNKLCFNMAKDDVDAFVTDMKTLASILGHNDNVLAEKFKDVFPDKNIEAALIAMDNLEDMQAKVKQLVQIYKPQQEVDSSLGACLMHQHQPAPKEKSPKKTKPKESNQHQLAPIQGKQGPNGNPNNSQGQRQRQYL